MAGRSRRKKAALFLGFAILPWLASAAAALHVLNHGDGDDAPVEAAMTIVVHGHSHPAGTTEHEHFLMPLPSTPSPVDATIGHFTVATATALPTHEFRSIRPRVATGGAGHGPPFRQSALIALRI